MLQVPNLILASLPQEVFAALQPHLQHTAMTFGDVIAETGEPIRKVYFPSSGVISLVVEMSVGEMIETAMVGRDGVANATTALNGKISLHRGIIQVAGEAASIEPDALRTVARRFEPLQAII